MHTLRQDGSHSETGSAIPGPQGRFRWDAGRLAALSGAGINSLHADGDDILWAGGDEGLYRSEPPRPQGGPRAFQALVRQVSRPGGRVIFGGGGSGAEVVLAHRENALRFEFAAPMYEGLQGNQYQVLLEGMDHGWGPWTDEVYRDYTNLPAGGYRFRVRARTPTGILGGEAAFAFRIRPPWYRHPAALALWLLVLAGAPAGAVRWRLATLNRRNRELSQAVTRATTELQAMNRRLYSLNDAKNRIIALAAHDLRNPLTAMLLTCELLEEELEGRKAAVGLERIRCLGRTMSELIQSLLNVHAIEAGEAEKPNLQPLDLEALAAMALENFGPAAQRKNIVLAQEWQGPCRARGDAARAGQILDNFLSNALKFSQPGTVVTLGIEAREDRQRVYVRDQGPGLSEEDLKRVFGEYARLSARPTAGEASVGLGLSLARRMAEAMGGTAGVHSVAGQGATFWLELPTS
jgi:signal transduction histidine kinase